MKPKQTILFSDYKITPPPPEHKEDCIKQSIASAGRIPRGGSFAVQLKTQLGYVGIWFWLGLVALCAALMFLMHWTLIWQQNPYASDRATIVVLSMCGPAIACLSAPVLSRSYTHGMWELEEASFHNLPRLTALRLTICLLAAIPIMVPIAVISFGNTKILLELTALIAPFLLTSAGNYLVLGRLRGSAGVWCCIGLNIVLGILFSLPFIWAPRLSQFSVQGNPQIFCILILLLCAGLFVLSARSYIRKSSMKGNSTW